MRPQMFLFAASCRLFRRCPEAAVLLALNLGIFAPRAQMRCLAVYAGDPCFTVRSCHAKKSAQRLMLLAFAMVCLAVLILRVKQPELERPYKTPFIYFVAPMGVAFNIFLMSQVRENTWYAFLIWGTLGVIIYFLYSRKHSNLNKAE